MTLVAQVVVKANFGEVVNGWDNKLSSSGLRVARPPQDEERCNTN